MAVLGTAEPRAVAGHSSRKVVVVSSRGPVEHYFDTKGRIARRPADGGVATVLSSVVNSLNTTWIASARNAADREFAKSGNALKLEGGSRLRLIAPPAEADRLHNDFCNSTLWFLQHSMLHLLDREDFEGEAITAWQQGYLPVNIAFAEAISAALGDDVDTIQIHDYHLYAAPLYIRFRYPNVFLQHFVHIPWPAAEEWASLPESIVEAICRGLLANDSVVFQTQASARNFIATCGLYLTGVETDPHSDHVVLRGHSTRVWSNPVSVDATALTKQVSPRQVAAIAGAVSPNAGDRTIVRVDRLDPSKNIDGGFEAYARLLAQHPDWRGHVRFLALLVPSRTDLAAYQAHERLVMAQIEAINSRYGRPDWTPITVFHEQNRSQALAAMTLYDVLLVNSRADGQNLVSKEGPLLNQRNGVLVLSNRAGSFEELEAGAIGIDPDDVEATAAALHQALHMSPVEREERASLLRHAIVRHQADDWLALLLRDMVRELEETPARLLPTVVPAYATGATG